MYFEDNQTWGELMKHILFVCTGNTCRSIMAEAILKDNIKNSNIPDESFTVWSAGIYAQPGEPASFNSREVLMDKWGIDIGGHRARLLKEEDVKKADLILTMTASHKSTVIAIFPQVHDKTYTLREYAEDICGKKDEKTIDVSDPYGEGIQVYEACAQEIRDLVDSIYNKLNTNFL